MYLSWDMGYNLQMHNSRKVDKAQTKFLAQTWARQLPAMQNEVREAQEILRDPLVTVDPRMNQILVQISDLRLHCLNKLEGK